MRPCGQCKFSAICFALGDDKMGLVWSAFKILYVDGAKGRKAKKTAKRSEEFMNQRPATCPARPQ